MSKQSDREELSHSGRRDPLPTDHHTRPWPFNVIASEEAAAAYTGRPKRLNSLGYYNVKL